MILTKIIINRLKYKMDNIKDKESLKDMDLLTYKSISFWSVLGGLISFLITSSVTSALTTVVTIAISYIGIGIVLLVLLAVLEYYKN